MAFSGFRLERCASRMSIPELRWTAATRRTARAGESSACATRSPRPRTTNRSARSRLPQSHATRRDQSVSTTTLWRRAGEGSREPHRPQPGAAGGRPGKGRTRPLESQRDRHPLWSGQAGQPRQPERGDQLARQAHRHPSRGGSERSDGLGPQRCPGPDRPRGSWNQPDGGRTRLTPGTPILLVESDRSLGQALARELAADGFHVRVARSAEHARSLSGQGAIALALLGGLEGTRTATALLAEIRGRGGHPGWENRDVPALVFAEVASGLEVLRAFDAGADDFMAAPAAYLELRARMRAILRRASPPPAERRAAVRLARPGSRTAPRHAPRPDGRALPHGVRAAHPAHPPAGESAHAR